MHATDGADHEIHCKFYLAECLHAWGPIGAHMDVVSPVARVSPAGLCVESASGVHQGHKSPHVNACFASTLFYEPRSSTPWYKVVRCLAPCLDAVGTVAQAKKAYLRPCKRDVAPWLKMAVSNLQLLRHCIEYSLMQVARNCFGCFV
jgi:hypothetical protein